MNKRLLKKKGTIGVGESKRKLKECIKETLQVVQIQEKANKQALEDVQNLNQRNTVLFDEKVKLVERNEKLSKQYTILKGSVQDCIDEANNLSNEIDRCRRLNKELDQQLEEYKRPWYKKLLSKYWRS